LDISGLSGIGVIRLPDGTLKYEFPDPAQEPTMKDITEEYSPKNNSRVRIKRNRLELEKRLFGLMNLDAMTRDYGFTIPISDIKKWHEEMKQKRAEFLKTSVSTAEGEDGENRIPDAFDMLTRNRNRNREDSGTKSASSSKRKSGYEKIELKNLSPGAIDYNIPEYEEELRREQREKEDEEEDIEVNFMSSVPIQRKAPRKEKPLDPNLKAMETAAGKFRRKKGSMYMLEPWEVMEKLNKELELYIPGLSKRVKLIIANKIDIPGSAENLKILKKKTNLPIIPVSALREENLVAIQEQMKILLSDHSKMDDEFNEKSTSGFLESENGQNSSDFMERTQRPDQNYATDNNADAPDEYGDVIDEKDAREDINTEDEKNI